MVLRWTRRARLWFWLLLPLGVFASVGGLAFGVASARDGHWITGLASFGMGIAVALLFFLWRGSVETYRRVSSATPLVTRSGRLHLRRVGRSFSTCIDDLAVVFVSSDVRRAVELDAMCVVEVIFEAPVLVITARPAGRQVE